MRNDDRPVTVELSGITEPATFARLSDALAALWESMRVLPLDAFSADCFHYYLTRPDAVQRVSETLEHSGDLALSFGLPDGPHVMHVRPALPPDADPVTAPADPGGELPVTT
ncbi:hypothetical protein P3T37_006589 [Kitasatospora sp. MAA4]|uniref:hypothetical protein n=1 Tax=Kitasatospora sp. MAA4 TaxID=3035093 RepID=UPI002476291E|nr:hypothetical protein [Kitasatospora sp. MAA4]MDH6137157.1 hypothetical protein [Kitasatospora sp. MAA4]